MGEETAGGVVKAGWLFYMVALNRIKLRGSLAILIKEKARMGRLKEMGSKAKVEGAGEKEGCGFMATMERLVCRVMRRRKMSCRSIFSL